MRIHLRNMRKSLTADALFPQTRQKILAATVMSPDRWWYLSDLARHLGVPPSSLQRELYSLVQAGILQNNKEGRHVYYRPDPDCPILAELQGIMAKTAGLVDVLRRALKPFDRSISLAFIFGSIARSRELSDSDIDLMMVTTEGLSSIAPALHQAEQQLSRPVNPVLYTPEEWTQKLAERHPFLQRVLDGEKLFIIGIQDDLATAA